MNEANLKVEFTYLNLLIFGGIINWTLAIFIQRQFGTVA